MAKGCEVRAVLYFKASKEIMLSRMMNRAPTSGRVDDNAEAFEKRYKGFVKEIEEIARYYERQNKLCEVWETITRNAKQFSDTNRWTAKALLIRYTSSLWNKSRWGYLLQDR